MTPAAHGAAHGAAHTRPDTHDMLVVHRVFRRESRLLAELVPAVSEGDAGRARVLAGHFRDYALGLHHHHSAEDDLLWPKLLARVDMEADLVLRMEAQHETISATLDQVAGLLPEWERTAAAPVRDQIALALTGHRAALVEHLGEEEIHILPLAEEHLTADEWAELGGRFATETPKDKLLYFLGALLEEATPEERAELLGGLPLLARLVWRTVGRRKYARRARQVRGQSG
ncbi:hemerythrin domain-containing protein [Planotetraspora sp. GP83]|uniref:hemerythrin domain-containing protein n=1 Tax=Planotetraspora sp. GP83 TaxID=3156264 RepID=UPI003513C8FC